MNCKSVLVHPIEKEYNVWGVMHKHPSTPKKTLVSSSFLLGKTEKDSQLLDSWVRFVIQEPSLLETLPLKIQSNRIFQKKLWSDGKQIAPWLPYFHPSLQDDKNVVWNAFLQQEEEFQFASRRLRSDVSFVSRVVQKKGNMLKYATEVCKQNEEIALLAIQNCPEAFWYIGQSLQQNKTFVCQAIRKNPSIFGWLSEELRQDEKIASLAFANSPSEDHWLVSGKSIQHNQRLTILALSFSEFPEMILSACPQEWLENDSFVLSVLKRNGKALFCFPSSFQNNLECLRIAVSQNFHVFRKLKKEQQIRLAQVL